jgi:hypothetical protein
VGLRTAYRQTGTIARKNQCFDSRPAGGPQFPQNGIIGKLPVRSTLRWARRGVATGGLLGMRPLRALPVSGQPVRESGVE